MSHELVFFFLKDNLRAPRRAWCPSGPWDAGQKKGGPRRCTPRGPPDLSDVVDVTYFNNNIFWTAVKPSAAIRTK